MADDPNLPWMIANLADELSGALTSTASYINYHHADPAPLLAYLRARLGGPERALLAQLAEAAPTYAILVENFWGDLDDLDDVFAIGPFDTAAERDAEMARLAGLPGVDGSARFHPFTGWPPHPHGSATRQESAAAVDLDSLIRAL